MHHQPWPGTRISGKEKGEVQMIIKLNDKKEEKGFTLIELMIVVAIIGILAAIAIPQFASYRERAFNSAAMSDLNTARMAEEALYADFQSYGSSVTAAATAGAAGAGTNLTANGWIATSNNTAAIIQSTPVTLSNNVTLVADTDANEAYATLAAQHSSGNKRYAAETDQSGTYQKTIAAGTAFATVGGATNGLDATVAKGYNIM